MRVFKVNLYAEAVNIWQKLDLSEPAVAAAVAEASFRQGSFSGNDPNFLSYLGYAVNLAPTDPIYAYHLGLALHKDGKLTEAMDAYRRAVANGLSRPEAGVVIGLAASEIDPEVDLSTLPGVSASDCQQLEPLANFLRSKSLPGKPLPGKSQIKSNRPSLWGQVTKYLKFGRSDPSSALVDGLMLLATGQIPEARQSLSAIKSKTLSPDLNVMRWYYLGLAAGRAGDWEAALDAWKEAHYLKPDMARLTNNIRAVYAQQSVELSEDGHWATAAETALAGLKLLPGDLTLSALALVALDRAAHNEVQPDIAGDDAGLYDIDPDDTGGLPVDWPVAAKYWAKARQVSSNFTGGGSRRLILHNLALAYEASEQWPKAAEAWQAVLRTRPKKRERGGWSNNHWLYTHRRIVECYRQAGRPDEAIGIFRQALKNNPNDPDMQLDLVETLLAARQEKTATRELRRLLKKHPRHVPALSRQAELYAREENWYAAGEAMRQAALVEPENQNLQYTLAYMLSERAHQLKDKEQYDKARTVFKEALNYTPDDYDLHFELARIEFSAHNPGLGRRHIEQALKLGHNKSEAYEQAFVCWVFEDNLEEAKNVLDQGQAGAQLTADFYIHAGLSCLEQAGPPPGPLKIENDQSKNPAQPGRNSKTNPMRNLGRELLEQAISIGPKTEVLAGIAMGLVQSQPQVGLQYARRLIEYAPDDATAQFALGILLGMNQQIKEGRATLRQAARTARKQGLPGLAKMAEECRRAMSPSLLSTIFRVPSSPDDFDFD